MNFFQAIILGIVQALTEYLPVSSSAHIRIFGDLMLGSDPGAAFTAIIQIGTELAVILYFRHDIINILTHWFSCLFGKNGKDWKARMGRGDNYATLGWNIIVGSIPIIILGFTLQNVIETSLRNLWITVTVLLVFGILLWMVDAKARQNKTMNDMTYRDAFLFSLVAVFGGSIGWLDAALAMLPLQQYQLGWVVPAILGVAIGIADAPRR